MNILHLTKDHISISGISTFLENLVNNDNQNRHFILSNQIGAEYLQKDARFYLDQKIKTSKVAFFKNIFLVSKLCEQYQIDIIHSHHRYFDLLAFFVKKKNKIKTIITIHSIVYSKRIFSYKSDIIVSVGENVKKHLIENFYLRSEKIRVINNFIDPNQISITRSEADIKEELKLSEDKYIIGFVGRFDKREKGIDILINAGLKIIEHFENVVFVLIGDGIDKKFVYEKTNYLKNHFVVVEPKNDIFNYMQIFDQFVLPSRIDPFPLVMIEAAYLKIPFIGSNVDGIAEFINDKIDGVLFEPGNEKELASKIITYIKNPNIGKKLAEKLHQKVINNFTAEKIIPQYDDLYKSVLME